MIERFGGAVVVERVEHIERTEHIEHIEPGPSRTATFAAEVGPFDRYERRVSWADDGAGHTVVTERTAYALALPFVGVLKPEMYGK